MERIHSKSNLSFSQLAVGFWRLANSEIVEPQKLLFFLESISELGISTLDHADIYGSYTCEALFGKSIKLQPGIRQKFELVSKCGIKMLSPNRPEHKYKTYNYSNDHILQSVENSLQNLHTDYLDVLLLHRPSMLLNPDEVAKAFDTLKTQGKVREFGVSNFTPSQFSLLQSRLSFPLIANQIELSVSAFAPFTNGELDYMHEHSVVPMAWSPLAGGKLLNPDFPLLNLLNRIGEMYNASATQIALAWLMKHPARIVPVIGSMKLERIKESAAACSLQITDEHWFEIYVATVGKNLP